MRKPDFNFMFIFIMKIIKNKMEDAKSGNNASFSAPTFGSRPRALREDNLKYNHLVVMEHTRGL